MEIRDFSSIRVGSEYPYIFDIKPIESHESYGVFAAISSVREDHRIELRENVFGEIALFNFKYNDLKLPDSWADSKILWSNKKKKN